MFMEHATDFLSPPRTHIGLSKEQSAEDSLLYFLLEKKISKSNLNLEKWAALRV